MPFTRRRFLLSSSAALFAPALALAQSRAVPVPSLRDLANGRWAVSNHLKSPDEWLEEDARTRTHCDTVTSEFGLKPNHLFRGRLNDCADFKRQLENADWAAAEHAAAFGLRYHLHAVYWPKGGDEACIHSDANLEAFIARIVPDSVIPASADVLNEVFKKVAEGSIWKQLEAPDFEDEELLGTLLHDSIPGETGRDKIDFLANVVRVFHGVAGSDVDMLINEDQLSWFGTSFGHKRSATLALVRRINARLEQESIALRGNGLQGHLIEGKKLSLKGLSAFAQTLERQGLELHISEFDIKRSDADKKLDHSEDRKNETAAKRAARLAAQEDENAKMATLFWRELLQHRNVVRAGFWGISDRESVMFQEGASLFDKGASPTLYGLDGTPKPIFRAIAKVFRDTVR